MRDRVPIEESFRGVVREELALLRASYVSSPNFWTLLKRTVKGTYICPRPWQLLRYVDAQAFRYNARELNDGERFMLTVKGADGKRLTYKNLTRTISPVQARTKVRQKAAQLKRWAAK